MKLLFYASASLFLAIVLLLGSVTNGQAQVTSFGNATIFKSKGDLDQVALAMVTPAADHSFILGSGIGNGSFALFTDTTKGIQLGLRGKERFINNGLPNDGVNIYSATPGASTPGTSLSTWNFDFHVDLGANLAPLVASGDVNAPGPLTPTGSVASVLLDVDFDPAIGVTNFVTLDLVANAIAGGATNPLLIQDSQNSGFGFWQTFFGAPPFDPNALGEYTFRLRAFDAAGQLCGAISINIVVSSTVAVQDTEWSKIKALYR